jgi:hypothetical protein
LLRLAFLLRVRRTLALSCIALFEAGCCTCGTPRSDTLPQSSPLSQDCSYGEGATVQRSVDLLQHDLGLHTLATHPTTYNELWVEVDGALKGSTLCPRELSSFASDCVHVELPRRPGVAAALETTCERKHVHVTGIFRDGSVPHIVVKEVYWTSPEGDLVQ